MKIKYLAMLSFCFLFILFVFILEPQTVQSASCKIKSFTADNSTPPYGSGTTLRFSLSESYPWTISILPGSENLPLSLSQGLVGYWKFDEGSGNTATDSSGKGNNGTLNNGPTWATGKHGGAINLDGINDYVQVSDSDSLTISGDLTLVAWIKKKSNSGADTIVRKGHNLSQPETWNRNYDFITNDDTIKWSWSGGDYYYFVNTPLSTDAWYQVVVAYTESAKNVKFYINGMEKLSDTENFPVIGQDGALTIGNNNKNGEYFDGLIDDLRIYNRTLTPQEITMLYQYATILPTPFVGTSKSDSAATGNLTQSQTYRLTCGSDIQDLTLALQYPPANPVPNPVYMIPQTQGANDHGDDEEDKDKTREMINIGSDKPLQDIISDAGYKNNVMIDQKQYQSWKVPNAPVIVEVTYLDSSTPYNYVFGYYPKGELSKFVPWFKKDAGNFYPSTPVLLPGQKITVTIPALSSVTFGIQSSQTDQTPLAGLVGHWKFDENSGTTATDSSGAGNTGTLKNGVKRVAGKFGKGLDFDGSNDYVDVLDAPSLKFGNNGTFTVSAWVYPRKVDDNNANEWAKQPIFVGKYPETGNGWRLQSSPSGRLNLEANDKELYGIVGRVVEKKWQLVTGVQRNNEVRLYVDGADVTDQFAQQNGNYDNTGSLRIGTSLKPAMGSCCQAWFDGIMDDVRIYNRALSHTEVVSLYEDTGKMLAKDVSTENSKNISGLDQALVYDTYTSTDAFPDDYLIGFEDLYGVGDADYNDLVVRVHALSGPNQVPSVDGGGGPQVAQPNYCVSGSVATINWTYSDPEGDPQAFYRVQIDDQGSFNNPEVDSGKISSSGTSYASGVGILQFNTTYKSRVKAWDSKGMESAWAVTNSWTTPKHAYPQTNFTWNPLNPLVGKQVQQVQFTDQTTFFDASGVGQRSWSWNFGDGATDTIQNPIYSYSVAGNYTVNLTATDKDGYSCAYSPAPGQIITVKNVIPAWKEVPPKP